MTKRTQLGLAFVIAISSLAHAGSETVTCQLVADANSVVAGRSFWVGVCFRIPKGQHIYWRNPGDAGLPTTVRWTLPDGFMAGEMLWPAPVRFGKEPVVGFGYADRALLMRRVTAPADVSGVEKVCFRATASWLACEKECIPGEADLALWLRVGDAGTDAPASHVRHFQECLHQLPAASLAWSFVAVHEGDRIRLTAAAPAKPSRRRPEHAGLFPYVLGLVPTAGGSSTDDRDRQTFSFGLKTTGPDQAVLRRLNGVLSTWDERGIVEAVRFDVPVRRDRDDVRSGGVRGVTTSSSRERDNHEAR